MANMAPMTAYQGSRGMKRMKEGSKADNRADKRSGENTRADAKHDRKRTVAGKSKRPRVKPSQTPFGGDDLAGA